MDAPLHEKARARLATLPGGREDPRHHPAERPVQVGVVEDDVGGLAAELEGRANSRVEAEAYSEGLITAVHPAASAGASFQLMRLSGEFQGVMTATTPLGS